MGGLLALGASLWLAERVVESRPAYAGVLVFAALLFSAFAVRRTSD